MKITKKARRKLGSESTLSPFTPYLTESRTRTTPVLSFMLSFTHPNRVRESWREEESENLQHKFTRRIILS
ncbi:hypothetical protein L6452_11961 [Arctium lappa]|uniref:Uncharacterized protein n=1 Tax=Arctium lappa TaxID=4217 RepID=A0ACB9DQ70_ARCLA|nr:hypothetical protein L6452_11961 [Arctium lappa]